MIKKFCIKNQKNFAFLLLLILFIYTMLSFCKSVFTGDIKVFMAVANQVKYQDGNLIQGLYGSWDMKGICHRGLMYIIYSAVNMVSNAYQSDKTLFQYLAKATYMAITIGVCFLSAYLMRRKYKFNNYSFLMLFMMFSILLLGCGLPIHIQAEMNVVTILFFSFILFLYNQSRTDYLCGVMLSLIFFFKSICILMIFSFIAACFFYKGNVSWKRLKKVVTGFLVFTILLLIITAIVYPQEFRDMIESSKFQFTLLSRGSSYSLRYMQTNFENNFINSSIMIPIILPGALLTLYSMLNFFKTRNYQKIPSLIAMWLFPILFVLISNQYFIYHYYLLAFPSIIMIFYSYKNFKEHIPIIYLSGLLAFAFYGLNVWVSKGDQSPLDFVNISVYSLMFLILICVIVFSILERHNAYYKKFIVFSLSGLFLFTYLNFNSYHSSYMIRQRELEEIASAQVKDFLNFYPEIDKAWETLFLDSGVSPFYIDNPSYSKYIYNLPLQRYRNETQGIWKSNQEELDNLMNYQGRFIIYSPWFNLDAYPQFKKKLEAEYHVFSESLTLYSIDWSFINLDTKATVGPNSVIYEANSYRDDWEEMK